MSGGGFKGTVDVLHIAKKLGVRRTARNTESYSLENGNNCRLTCPFSPAKSLSCPVLFCNGHYTNIMNIAALVSVNIRR